MNGDIRGLGSAAGGRKSEAVPEVVIATSAALLEARHQPSYVRALVEMNVEEREHIEASLRAIHPGLPAAAVDNAAHGALRRLWSLAPDVASGCATAEEFKKQLYKLLARCVTFSGLDEVRKHERQKKILETQFLIHWEVEGTGGVGDQSKAEEVEDLLVAMRAELIRTAGLLTLKVLEVIRDQAMACGGHELEGQERASNEKIAQELKNRGICVSGDDVKRARERIKAIAERVMAEQNWSFRGISRSCGSDR